MINKSNIIAFALTSLLFLSCASKDDAGKENSNEGSFLDVTLGKCVNFTAEIYGDHEDFGVLRSRIDESDIVKLAVDEKYESEMKYISSITFRANGKEDYCDCYHNKKGDIINKEMYQKN